MKNAKCGFKMDIKQLALANTNIYPHIKQCQSPNGLQRRRFFTTEASLLRQLVHYANHALEALGHALGENLRFSFAG